MNNEFNFRISLPCCEKPCLFTLIDSTGETPTTLNDGFLTYRGTLIDFCGNKLRG